MWHDCRGGLLILLLIRCSRRLSHSFLDEAPDRSFKPPIQYHYRGVLITASSTKLPTAQPHLPHAGDHPHHHLGTFQSQSPKPLFTSLSLVLCFDIFSVRFAHFFNPEKFALPVERRVSLELFLQHLSCHFNLTCF